VLNSDATLSQEFSSQLEQTRMAPRDHSFLVYRFATKDYHTVYAIWTLMYHMRKHDDDRVEKRL
jgi:hypothetical protein